MSNVNSKHYLPSLSIYKRCKPIWKCKISYSMTSETLKPSWWAVVINNDLKIYTLRYYQYYVLLLVYDKQHGICRDICHFVCKPWHFKISRVSLNCSYPVFFNKIKCFYRQKKRNIIFRLVCEHVLFPPKYVLM